MDGITSLDTWLQLLSKTADTSDAREPDCADH